MPPTPLVFRLSPDLGNEVPFRSMSTTQFPAMSSKVTSDLDVFNGALSSSWITRLILSSVAADPCRHPFCNAVRRHFTLRRP